jgi:hypothetical protein
MKNEAEPSEASYSHNGTRCQQWVRVKRWDQIHLGII